tara:strand:+ start:695 stop:964 length:270 start_codon:yes stop_codon:yes gene_type:complete
MNTVQLIKDDIMQMNHKQLEEISFAVQMRKARLNAENRRMFDVGDVVTFGNAKRGTYSGTIDKIKIKKAIVVDDNGTRWNVPLNMLEIA